MKRLFTIKSGVLILVIGVCGLLIYKSFQPNLMVFNNKITAISTSKSKSTSLGGTTFEDALAKDCQPLSTMHYNISKGETTWTKYQPGDPLDKVISKISIDKLPLNIDSSILDSFITNTLSNLAARTEMNCSPLQSSVSVAYNRSDQSVALKNGLPTYKILDSFEIFEGDPSQRLRKPYTDTIAGLQKFSLNNNDFYLFTEPSYKDFWGDLMPETVYISGTRQFKVDNNHNILSVSVQAVLLGSPDRTNLVNQPQYSNGQMDSQQEDLFNHDLIMHLTDSSSSFGAEKQQLAYLNKMLNSVSEK